MKQKILVTGGLGYIGQHVVKELFLAGYEPVILDIKQQIPNKIIKNYCTDIHLYHDVCNVGHLNQIFSRHKIYGIIHLAGLISVPESQKNASQYYTNNVIGSINVLNAAVTFGIEGPVVFASTAAVYGDADEYPINENAPRKPMTVYANNKAIIEDVLIDYNNVHDLKYAVLRFFNVAGGDIEGEFGNPNPDSLISRIVKNDKSIDIYGNDYNTKDGTCERDYIHVNDLSTALVSALLYCEDYNFITCNVGAGISYTNKEVAERFKKLCNNDFVIRYADRRIGDIQTSLSDISVAKQQLNFQPQYSDLTTAYNWEINSNHG
jgi:UDP-glucose 4-epimerase